MFSGKTSHLVAELVTMADLGYKTIYINHSKDSRDDKYSTHRSTKAPTSDKITWVKAEKLQDVNMDNYRVIGIDESHWFEDLTLVVRKYLLMNKIVIVAGLSGSYQQKPFGHTLDLIPMAEEVVKLKAFCLSCNKEGILKQACFTKRTVASEEETLVGGGESYTAVCRKHL